MSMSAPTLEVIAFQMPWRLPTLTIALHQTPSLVILVCILWGLRVKIKVIP